MLQWIALATVALASAGCGNGRVGGLGIVTLDPSIDEDQQILLEGDLTTMSSLSLEGDANLMGAESLNGPALLQWLKARVKVVVGESFNFLSNLGWDPAGGPPEISGTALLQTPALASLGFDSTNDPVSDNNVVTVMTNLGALFYIAGKRTEAIYTVDLDSGPLRITSPRVGLLQVGAGLFTVSRVATSAPDSFANQLIRIAVLCHEARHSDGNNADAGLPHARCTSGAYAGRMACESYSNGPYAVQAMLLDSFVSACRNCSVTELTVMRTLLADFRSRLLPGARYADQRPEAYQ